MKSGKMLFQLAIWRAGRRHMASPGSPYGKSVKAEVEFWLSLGDSDVKRKSTEEYKSLPYICTLLGSSPWTYYGIVTPGEYLVSTVNGFGALVEIIYVSLFVLYAPRHLKVPNGVGFVFGTMQLILYGIYRNAKPVGSSKGWSDIVADEEKGLTSRVPLLT
ncbi:hypothetical protein Bca101_091741 [Brassica carinata]